jgi:formylglycine-generating enzyme
MLVGLWFGACGGKVTGSLEVTATGGSASGAGGTGHDAGPAGSAGAVSTGGTAGSAGSGGSSGCGSVTCGPLEQCFDNDLCVAKLVPVTGGYGVDATEVTAAQYAAWLATSPSPTALPVHCTSWRSSFHPGEGTGNHPVVKVDWCDAYGYCAGVGKRLCGKIGAGPNAYGSYKDAAKSQWFNACSSGNANGYPYGNAYDGQACNGYEEKESGCWKGNCSLLPVASLAGCQSTIGGYEGVFDLSGNVYEWEDSCEATSGHDDACRMRGGSNVDALYYFTHERCDYGSSYFRGFTGAVHGFRCCSDP